jgi:transcriptional regulator with XRE-family HTH domain
MEGSEIRKLREDLGLTQEAMARRIGIRAITISRWERGQCRPTSEIVLRALEALRSEAINRRAGERDSGG